MLNFTNVSIWPIIIAGALNLILGMLWYGPIFGKKWMSYTGSTEAERKEMSKSAVSGYIVSFITALILGYVIELIMNLFIENVADFNIQSGLSIGFFLWIGISVFTAVKPIFWENKPKGLFVINTGFDFLCIMLIVLVAFYI